MFNVTRPNPAPESLARKTNYASEDVLIALKEMFHDKCYLCESLMPTSLNVEHLKSHRGEDDDKKFDWNNLYFSCARCNNIKSTRYDDILDCADPLKNVFKEIKLQPPLSPDGITVLIEPMSQDAETIKTVMLLNEIYNGDGTANKMVTGVYLRKSIFKSYNKLMNFMIDYDSDTADQEQKNHALRAIRVLMEKRQEFSAFLRWIILCDHKFSKIFADDLND